MRHRLPFHPILVTVIAAGFAVGCAPSPASIAARLINATMTKAQVIIDGSNVLDIELPEQLTCKSRVYEVAATVEGRMEPATGTASGYVTFNGTASGPGLFGSEDEGAPVKCALNVRYKLESSTGLSDGQQLLLSGGGTVTSCSSFNCVVDGQAVGCEELNAALATETCSN